MSQKGQKKNFNVVPRMEPLDLAGFLAFWVFLLVVFDAAMMGVLTTGVSQQERNLYVILMGMTSEMTGIF